MKGGNDMARPKKNPDALRSETVSFRCTPVQSLRIAQAAARAGLTPTEYARRQTLDGHVVVPEYRPLDPALLDEIHSIGVNLNQLARIANQKGRIPPELAKLCADIDRILARELAL
jgi:Bacterial mobilisation protein (MobC)